MAGFQPPTDLTFNRGRIDDPAAFARDANAASWLYMCGAEFAVMEGGMSYSDVEAAVPESANVVSDPPRVLDMDLARRNIAALDELPRPTLVTCRAGPRSSAVVYLYAGLRAGATADEVLACAEADAAPFSGNDELTAWVTQGLAELRAPQTQESVWDYPRPPRLEMSPAHIVVRLGGRVLAETRRSLRVLETSHPPVHYIPPSDIRLDRLSRTGRRSYCEFKGTAEYWAEAAGEEIAWSYPDPAQDFAALRDHLAFYPSRVDEIVLDGERVIPQAGDFYGGWITSKVVGPFKGEPGTLGW